MAYCKRLNVLAFLLNLLVFVQLLDETIARHTFVIVPQPGHKHGWRHRRQSETENPKPVMKSLRIDSVIKYRYANTVVYSKIVNSANESRAIDFRTILPDSAFISGFAITMNGTVYKAYVKEKEEARKIYQEALEQGRTAGHVELSARDSNTFTVSVNVEAFGKVAFNLTYEEFLSRELGTYKHKISLNPGQIVKDMNVQVVIQESSNIIGLRVPNLRESNELLADDNSENNLVTKEQPNGTTAIIRWAITPFEQKEIAVSGVKGVLEVRYDVDRTEHPTQILINEGYFVHFFAPPNLAPLHKHVVFVLDRSGSMYGRKIEQLKQAMSSILDELRSADSFSIILFSDNIQIWLSDGRLINAETRGEPLSALAIASATPEKIQAAKDTVNDVDAMGGTHIYDALDAALRVVELGLNSTKNNLTSQSAKEPLVIFLTDGQANGPMSDSENIINHTTTINQNLSAVLYGLAFGNDADFGLLKKLSLKNSGFARKIYEASDASLQLKNFYREVSSPLLSDVNFHYLEGQVDLNSLTKTHFQTYNNGSEIAIAGKLANGTDLHGNVTGRSVTGNISLTANTIMEVIDYWPRPQVIQNASEAGFMERLWAYLTIRQLLDLKEQTDNETVKEEAKALALKYSFVTPLTSLVVVKPNDTQSAAGLETTQTQSGRTQHGRIMFSAAMPGPGSFSYQAAGTGAYARTHSMMPLYSFDSNGYGSIAPASSHGRGRNNRRGHHGRKHQRTTELPVQLLTTEDDTDSQSISAATNPHGNATVALSTYTWFASVSNATHITLLVNGAEETLKIGYSEADIPHSACSSTLSPQSHCRHLPHCALPNFSQDINVYLQYFCRIDNFVGVCCPDQALSQGQTTTA